MRRRPIEVGGRESMWVGLRNGCRTGALIRAGNGCISRLEEEEKELTFGPRVGGTKGINGVASWAASHLAGSERGAVHAVTVFAIGSTQASLEIYIVRLADKL